MKKFWKGTLSCALLLALICVPSVTHAGFVRISDLGTERFVALCNYIFAKNNQPRIEIDDDFVLSDELYDAYLGVIKYPGEPIPIFIYANKEGYVSKIKIGGRSSMGLEMGIVMSTILMAAGLSKDEVFSLAKQLSEHERTPNVWCKATKRRIICEWLNDNSSNVPHVIVLFNAYDQ